MTCSLLEQETFPQRERPALPVHPLAEPVPEGDLRRVTAHRARRPEPQRKTDIPALSGRLIAVPRAPIVEKGREPERHEAENFVGHENPVLEHEPRSARTGEVVDAEQPRPALHLPGVELRTGFRIRHEPALRVHDPRVARNVLTHDGDLGLRARRVQAIRGDAQHREAALPDRRRLPADLVSHTGLQHDAGPQRGREVYILASRVGVEVLEHTKPYRTELDTGAPRREHRVRHARGISSSEIFTSPFPTTPNPGVVVTRRRRRYPGHQSDAKQPMARAIEERVIAKAQYALAGELAICFEGMRRRGLVKRQPEFPLAAVAVRKVAVPHIEQRPAAEEVRVDEFEV